MIIKNRGFWGKIFFWGQLRQIKFFPFFVGHNSSSSVFSFARCVESNAFKKFRGFSGFAEKNCIKTCWKKNSSLTYPWRSFGARQPPHPRRGLRRLLLPPPRPRLPRPRLPALRRGVCIRCPRRPKRVRRLACVLDKAWCPNSRREGFHPSSYFSH